MKKIVTVGEALRMTEEQFEQYWNNRGLDEDSEERTIIGRIDSAPIYLEQQ